MCKDYNSKLTNAFSAFQPSSGKRGVYEEQVAELLGRTGTIGICMKVSRGVEVLGIFLGGRSIQIFSFLVGGGVF